MENTAIESNNPTWKSYRPYFRVGQSPLEWNPADPTAVATLNGNRRESSRANRALCDYCANGQSLKTLLETYASDPGAPTHSLDTLKKWSVTWSWRDRVDAFNELRSQEQKRLYYRRLRSIIETGLSLRHERIERLKTVYSTLETFLNDPDLIAPRQVKKIPAPDGGFELVETRRFNAEIFIQLRGVLADLARETSTFPPPLPERPEQEDNLDFNRLTRQEFGAFISLFNKAEGKPPSAYDTIILGPSDPEPQ